MMKFLIVKNMKEYYERGYVLNIRQDGLQFCNNKKEWLNTMYTPAFQYLDTNRNYLSMELHGEDFFVFYSPFRENVRSYSLRRDVKDMLVTSKNF